MVNSYEIYEKTGTFAPLVNIREYTDDEIQVLEHFFTNVDKNVYCATDALSSQLWAFLVGQYSRSTLSMRDRFLQLFEDAQHAFREGRIEESEYVSLESLAESIRDGNFKSIKFFNDKASMFLKKWGVDYGHSSLKDADRIRFAIEGVSQVFTKVIEAPFPTIGDFQEKSTRYLHFGKESIIYSPVIEKSKFGVQVREVNDELMELYEKYLPIVKQVLVENQVVKREDFERESAFKNTLNAKTFDIVRYLLPSGTATCLGASFSTRICESHISEMLSSPIEEVRYIAKSMHNEALKISHGLLSHVKENEYLISKRDEVQSVVDDIFYKKNFDEIHTGVENIERVKLVSYDNIDNIVLSSILFEYSRNKGISFQDCVQRVEFLSDVKKQELMKSELGLRGKFDRMPRSLQHGKICFEFLCDFGAYRDIQRHRASSQLWQGATAILGFDYPELIDLKGFEEFKKDYETVMLKITNLSREIVKELPYENEYVCALGHLIRTTFEMHPGQLAYVIEMRTTPQGHHSYRELFQEVFRQVKEVAPIFSKYIRASVDLESTRIKQEEKAAKKRDELGIN